MTNDEKTNHRASIKYKQLTAQILLHRLNHPSILGHPPGKHHVRLYRESSRQCSHSASQSVMKPGYDVFQLFSLGQARYYFLLGKDSAEVADWNLLGGLRGNSSHILQLDT